MLYKFTETKVYFIEAETEDEALDKYSELHNADLTVEVASPDEASLSDFFNSFDPLEMARRYGKEYMYHLKAYQDFAAESVSPSGNVD